MWCSAGVSDVSKVIKYSRFHIYADDLQIYHSSSVSDLQRCYDEINMDLNPEKNQVILLQIHRCRADIGTNVVKVVPKVKNLGYVSFEEGVSEGLLDSTFYNCIYSF
jgi:hypothetical protein